MSAIATLIFGPEQHDLAHRALAHVCPKRRGDQLAAQADAERRAIGRQPSAQHRDFIAQPGKSIGIIDAHRSTHDHQQIGRQRIERRTSGMVRGYALDDISRRLDRLAIAGNAFMIDVAEDKCALHPVRLARSCCIATKLHLACPAIYL